MEAAEEVRRKGLVGGHSPATGSPRSGVAEAVEGTGSGALLLERPSVSRAGAAVEAAEEVRRKGLVGGRSPVTSSPRSGAGSGTRLNARWLL